MLPQSQARKPRNSSRTNLVISLVFHGALVFVALYFAASKGILGRQLQMAVTMEHEKPVAKPPEKKPEPPKEDPTPKLTVAPKLTTESTPTPATTASAAPPVMAPPAVDVPSFSFDGGRDVNDADPVTIYKNLIEESVRSKWQRPDMADKDKDFVADVEVSVDASGRIGSSKLTRGSGNPRWDDSVKQAVAQTANLGQAPPKGFPKQVIVRFDVAEDKPESIFQ
jgi:TonB family protein